MVASTTQAVPLLRGKINVGAGTYTAESLIHCETAGSITLLSSEGDTVYPIKEDADRQYTGDFTVTSGTFTYA